MTACPESGISSRSVYQCILETAFLDLISKSVLCGHPLWSSISMPLYLWCCRQDFNTVLQQLHKLPFIPDRQGIVKRCQDDTNKRLHVAIKPRLSSIISAAQKAFAASRQSDKLSALARYAASVDCIDQGIVSEINKAASQML